MMSSGVDSPAQHEGVGHAGHRHVREALAPSVAGRFGLHQPRVEAILQVAAQDALFDQHGARGRRAFVVNIETATAVRDRAVVDDGAELAGDRLPDPPREGRHTFAVEVALEAVADRLMEQDSGPSVAEHDDHFAGGRIDRVEVDDRLARGVAACTLSSDRLRGNSAIRRGRRRQNCRPGGPCRLRR